MEEEYKSNQMLSRTNIIFDGFSELDNDIHEFYDFIIITKPDDPNIWKKVVDLTSNRQFLEIFTSDELFYLIKSNSYSYFLDIIISNIQTLKAKSFDLFGYFELPFIFTRFYQYPNYISNHLYFIKYLAKNMLSQPFIYEFLSIYIDFLPKFSLHDFDIINSIFNTMLSLNYDFNNITIDISKNDEYNTVFSFREIFDIQNTSLFIGLSDFLANLIEKSPEFAFNFDLSEVDSKLFEFVFDTDIGTKYYYKCVKFAYILAKSFNSINYLNNILCSIIENCDSYGFQIRKSLSSILFEILKAEMQLNEIPYSIIMENLNKIGQFVEGIELTQIILDFCCKMSFYFKHQTNFDCLKHSGILWELEFNDERIWNKISNFDDLLFYLEELNQENK